MFSSEAAPPKRVNLESNFARQLSRVNMVSHSFCFVVNCSVCTTRDEECCSLRARAALMHTEFTWVNKYENREASVVSHLVSGLTGLIIITRTHAVKEVLIF